ncbi:hypothetical protein FORC9_3417 [Vibrio vulnificus]|nr:hypothetical protein FORC9_3417 [Vibrio vulnificus]ANH65294.1 hypothetical protein FORC16_3411 [Vibrio vulnificus]
MTFSTFKKKKSKLWSLFYCKSQKGKLKSLLKGDICPLFEILNALFLFLQIQKKPQKRL